jgi:uncharacterized protein
MPGARVCYLEIPARDAEESARFYERVFGWTPRTRGDGALAFDDTGSVSGTWVTDRPPMKEPGILVYIMVEDAEATLAKVTGEGGQVVMPLGAQEPPGTAHFTDPFGNVVGIYQEE